MKVSIIIVGFRNKKDIQDCLEALSYSRFTDFDVVICENGGKLAYEKLISLATPLLSGQKVEVCSAGRNLGFAGGVNMAMRMRPHADAWWILNPDTAPSPQCLLSLVERLGKGDCSLVGGSLLTAGNRLQSVGGKWNMWQAKARLIDIAEFASSEDRTAYVEESIDFVSGASMLVGREVVEKVGYMREDYFLYGEEVEWCVRMKLQGLRLGFAENANVVHNQGSTTGSGKSLSQRPRLPVYLDERNRLHIVRDCSSKTRFVTALTISFCILTLRFLCRGYVKQWVYALQGWAAGVRNMRGPPTWLRD